MITFDENGYINPYKKQNISFEDFKFYFVQQQENSQRKMIYNYFEDFIFKLKTKLNSNFYVFINGSFTTKKEEPNDIDFVVFIPEKILENKKIIEELKKEFYLYKNKHLKLLDFYILPDCQNNKNSKHFEIYNEMYNYWTNHFLYTEPNEFGIKQSKGFIEINF